MVQDKSAVTWARSTRAHPGRFCGDAVICQSVRVVMHLAKLKTEDAAALDTIYDASFVENAADCHESMAYTSDWEFSGRLCYESST